MCRVVLKRLKDASGQTPLVGARHGVVLAVDGDRSLHRLLVEDEAADRPALVEDVEHHVGVEGAGLVALGGPRGEHGYPLPFRYHSTDRGRKAAWKKGQPGV
jgi:hypothetical protein